RRGHDQVHATANHRPWVELHLPERTEEGAEGMSRRRFLQQTSALGLASLMDLPGTAAAEPALETTKIRLVPQYLAEELLRLEGFTEVQYVDISTDFPTNVLGAGEADLSMDASPTLVYFLDAGKSVVALAGIHAGC